MKIFLYFLVLLNIGFFTVHYFKDAERDVAIPENPHGVERLVLLHEFEQPASGQSATGIFSESPGQCLLIGPFANESGASNLRDRLSDLYKNSDIVRRTTPGPDRYLVLLPKMPRAEALRITTILARKGFRDYYLGAGHFIGLGLFADWQAAQRRKREVARLGFIAEISPQSTAIERVWLQLHAHSGTEKPEIDITHFAAEFPEIRFESMACDLIAGDAAIP